MPNFTGKSGGGPFRMKKYGQGKNPIMLTEAGKKAIMASDANAEFKAAIEKSPITKYGKSSPKKMYGKSTMKKKKPLKERSRAEQRAVFASGYKG